MALNSSGPISLNGATTGQSASIEIGLGAGAQIDMLSANVRSLTGVATGPVRMPDDFLSKSWRRALTYTFSTNTTNASLNVTSISGYIAGRSDIVVNVNSSVYLWSNSTSTPGLTLTGGTAGDTVTLVNNGFIMGMGGVGGTFTGRAGGNGGIALQLGYTTTINNTNAAAYIGGGGGGGYAQGSGGRGGGGGAGGGNGGFGYTSGVAGGSGGGIGAVGGNGNPSGSNAAGLGGGAGGGGGGTNGDANGSGGGGGRIFPGVGGAGGGITTQIGGAGGSANGAGAGSSNNDGGGGGGGWGAAGGGGGSSGGRAVFLNGYSVTWVSGDTTRVYGAVSN